MQLPNVGLQLAGQRLVPEIQPDDLVPRATGDMEPGARVGRGRVPALERRVAAGEPCHETLQGLHFGGGEDGGEAAQQEGEEQEEAPPRGHLSACGSGRRRKPAARGRGSGAHFPLPPL